MEAGQLFGILFEDRRRCQTAVVTEHLAELEPVDHRLAAGIVVGEHERRSSILLDLIDALLPFEKLFARVEIVVRRSCPVGSAELALPMLRIAPVEPDISDARG